MIMKLTKFGIPSIGDLQTEVYANGRLCKPSPKPNEIGQYYKPAFTYWHTKNFDKPSDFDNLDDSF
jgi:hypothetical protein